MGTSPKPRLGGGFSARARATGSTGAASRAGRVAGTSVTDREPETLDPIGRLLAECLAAVEREGEGAADRICRAHPEHAEVLRARLRLLEGFAPGSRGARPASAHFPQALGDFRLVREIGRGGMGVVYEAEQISLRRRVALKVLPAHLTLRPEAVSRFHREASTAARLNHPGIVQVFAVGEADGAHFFAMEFVEGSPLSDVVRRKIGRPHV